MSRQRGPQGPGISLFPFLAVLLCTMGALLVLLVIFSRSASQQVASVEASASAELIAMKVAIEQRLDQLAVAKAQAVEALSQSRLQLAGIEEHARSLEDEFSSLEKMAKSLAAGDVAHGDPREVETLEHKLADAKEKLEKAKAEASSKPPAYAVVPYEGAHGTHRRPLYIECSVDGVFLQPEGIRLRPSDFEGPPGPGNPLASALRAAREHIASTNAASAAPDAQPYPLLLVRPSGVMAYYAAREAITSWGSEFGYQLIDEDWQLVFPPPDPALADVERRAVDEARARLQWLAEVRPAKPAKPAVKYRAATTRGGVVTSGGPSVLGDRGQFDWTDEQASGGEGGGSGGSIFGKSSGSVSGRTNGGAGGGTSGGGNGGTGSTDGMVPIDQSKAGRLVAGGGRGSQGGGAGGPGGEGGTLGAGTGESGPGGDSAVAGKAGAAGANGSPQGDGGRPDGDVSGGSVADASSRFGNGSGSSAAGASTGSPTSDTTAAAGGGTSAGGSSSASGGQPPPGATSMPTPGMLQLGGEASGGTASASLARSRGSNWASLATHDHPIPLSRPIQVECTADEFRVYDDARKRVVARVPIKGHTATAIDPLVKVVHERVASWGLAGDRMYWKPQLLLSETPDGQIRRAELERLLADSGIETLRGHSIVAPLPAVTQGAPAPAGRIR